MFENLEKGYDKNLSLNNFSNEVNNLLYVWLNKDVRKQFNAPKPLIEEMVALTKKIGIVEPTIPKILFKIDKRSMPSCDLTYVDKKGTKKHEKKIKINSILMLFSLFFIVFLIFAWIRQISNDQMERMKEKEIYSKQQEVIKREPIQDMVKPKTIPILKLSHDRDENKKQVSPSFEDVIFSDEFFGVRFSKDKKILLGQKIETIKDEFSLSCGKSIDKRYSCRLVSDKQLGKDESYVVNLALVDEKIYQISLGVYGIKGEKVIDNFFKRYGNKSNFNGLSSKYQKLNVHYSVSFPMANYSLIVISALD